MRAVVIAKHGGLDVLQVQERPEPSPGPGQVRIDVRAAGVNFADTLARVGLYADAPKPPCVVGYEVAGTIAAVGDGVDAGRVGERVMAGTAFGGYASQVVVPQARCGGAARAPVLRGGRRGAGRLRHGVGVAVRLRLAARGRARPRPRCRRRCRHRRAAAGQARRGRGPRHGVAGQARAAARARPRPRHRLPPRRLVARPAQLRPRHRRHRRRLVQALQRAAAPRRAPRRPRRVVRPGGRDAQPAPRAAAGPADDARLRPAQADGRVQVVHRDQHEAPVGRPRHAGAVDRAL